MSSDPPPHVGEKQPDQEQEGSQGGSGASCDPPLQGKKDESRDDEETTDGEDDPGADDP
jgi:hypothetical protein